MSTRDPVASSYVWVMGVGSHKREEDVGGPIRGNGKS